MKSTTLLLCMLFLFVFQLQILQAQDKKIKHNFKISGSTKLDFVAPLSGKLKVEYDPNSPDHLFISYFDKDGLMTSKRQYLFKENQFNLENTLTYFKEKQLITDGVQLTYLDGQIVKEEIVKEDKLIKRTTFYPDGKKELMVSGDEKILNGEYQMWYPSGQISFSGYYTNGLKNGDFQLFDPSGTPTKKGVYKDGKLVTGEAVVQDVVYEFPEKPAQYANGNEDFDGFLKRKSTEIEELKVISGEHRIKLSLYISKTGTITKIEPFIPLQQPDMDIVNAVFADLPSFTPASIENIPVESVLRLNLVLSKEGTKMYIDRNIIPFNGIFTEAEPMPQFPGGEEALRKYLYSHIRYPVEALKSMIQGKVFVSFVVVENGDVINVKLARGVDYYLDKEAIRIVKMMPRWQPGLINGNPVKVSFTLPITFRLE